jgi:hypothetical protein
LKKISLFGGDAIKVRGLHSGSSLILPAASVVIKPVAHSKITRHQRVLPRKRNAGPFHDEVLFSKNQEPTPLSRCAP